MDTGDTRNTEPGELNMVKGEINGGYMDLLGIGGLKWVGIGFFQSEEHTVHCPGHKKQGAPFIVRQD